MSKDKDYKRLIHTGRWLRLRKQVLTETPLCSMCKEEGRLEPACEVHHIRPVEEAIGYAEKEQRMYDAHNLLALCHNCHVKVHTQMGRCGKKATKERNRRQAEAAIKKLFGDEA